MPFGSDWRKRLGVELTLIAFFATVILTIITTYILSVYYDHVPPYFPYISSTGRFPPESCVMSLGFSIAVIFGLVIVCTRYKHVKYVYSQSAHNISCLNKFSTSLGFLSFAGLLIVASFQSEGRVAWVHEIGAFSHFFFGLLYMCFQTVLTVKIHRAGLTSTGRCLLATRILLCLAGLFMACLQILWGGLHRWLDCYHSDYECARAFALLSTSGEWVLGIFFLLYFLTFHWDFVGVALSVKVKTRHRGTTIIGNMLYDEDTPLTL